MIVQNWAKDYVDERNYSYSEIRVGWTKLKDFVVNDSWEFQNQYAEWYPMGCVYYSSSEHDNYLNKRDKIDTRTKGSELCDISTTWSPIDWDYTINWAKLLKELSHIKWFFAVKTVDEALEILSNWNNIHVGSNSISYSKTKKAPYIAVLTGWPWHCFHIIGYNNTDSVIAYSNHIIPPKCFIIKDSSNGFDNWFFYIRIVDFYNALFPTKLFFTNDTTLIDNYKKKMLQAMNLDSAKLMFLLGLTNWERPVDKISREEALALNFRVMKSILEGSVTLEDITSAEEELKRLEEK